jgi:catechol 2,3-dioxygenase-like lactoylglutathione lyase family enzyme
MAGEPRVVGVAIVMPCSNGWRRYSAWSVVRDVVAALAYYEALGFRTRSYDEGIYGFATRDGVEFHLGSIPAGHEWTRTTAYLYVDNADQLAAEWRAAGAEVHGPEDTNWGQHEGALVDIDGNVIRFGSPMH